MGVSVTYVICTLNVDGSSDHRGWERPWKRNSTRSATSTME